MKTAERRSNEFIRPYRFKLYRHQKQLVRIIKNIKRSTSFKETKQIFRSAILEYNFTGYICDYSILEIAHDYQILGTKEKNNILSYRNINISDYISGYYNDLGERFGVYAHEYVEAVLKLSDKFPKLSSAIRLRSFLEARKTPFLLLSDTPRAYHKHIYDYTQLSNRFVKQDIADLLSIPITANTGETVFFWLLCGCQPKVEDILNGTILVHAFHTACLDMVKSDLVENRSDKNYFELGSTQIECLRWAVAGKTIDDIAVLTGLSPRTVRYHIDQARQRYGYATREQTLVRAAHDYYLDPLDPEL